MRKVYFYCFTLILLSFASVRAQQVAKKDSTILSKIPVKEEASFKDWVSNTDNLFKSLMTIGSFIGMVWGGYEVFKKRKEKPKPDEKTPETPKKEANTEFKIEVKENTGNIIQGKKVIVKNRRDS